ncbi:MAG: hypothetical protein M5R36_02605 [Deltaproteobacteria bacterium]|nr:hypothetical protein [Deltaproteobacteria bacterium]
MEIERVERAADEPSDTMPRLRLDDLERHDDEALQGGPAGDMGVLADLDHGNLRLAEDEETAKPTKKDESIKSLLMEAHEVDGHETKEPNAPELTSDTDLSKLMLQAHETYGEDAATQGVTDLGAEPENVSEMFTLKPLNLQPGETPPPPPEESGSAAGGGPIDLPFDPMPFSEGGPTLTTRQRRKQKKVADEAHFFEYRHLQGKRRLFTRVLPLAAACLALWFVGSKLVLPFLLVQGSWEGKIVGERETESVSFLVSFERAGRRLQGDVVFDIPKTETGDADLARIPKAVQNLFLEGRGRVQGEFDTLQLNLKFFSKDPDEYIRLAGDVQRDGDFQMYVTGDATGQGEDEAKFALVRTSLF